MIPIESTKTKMGRERVDTGDVLENHGEVG